MQDFFIKSRDYTLKALSKCRVGFRQTAQCLDSTRTFPLPIHDLMKRNGRYLSKSEGLDSRTCPFCHR